MSGDQRLIRYTRWLARFVLAPSAVWAIVVLTFFAPKLEPSQLAEFVILWPAFYWLTTTLLAALVVVRPPRAIVWRHIVCGIFEGVLLAYAFQCLMFASNRPSVWHDGIFQWAALCLPFFWIGPPLGFAAVVIRLVTLAIRSRSRHNPT